MSVVLETVSFCSSWRQRQHRVETIQRLNRCLFIYAEHRRMLRRIHVQADDICGFAFKIGIVARQIAFQTMWFQAGLGQNALHRGLAHA
jgi:hypothetical protein